MCCAPHPGSTTPRWWACRPRAGAKRWSRSSSPARRVSIATRCSPTPAGTWPATSAPSCSWSAPNRSFAPPPARSSRPTYGGSRGTRPAPGNRRGMAEVLTDLRDGVLTVTLHRPSRLNALSVSLQRELAALWARVRGDAGIRCIVVTGAGRAFCAGADAADLEAMTGPQAGDRERIEFCPAACVDGPVLVAVNGPCLGAGLRLLADADLAIASDLAWFSDPHVSVGQLGTPVALALAEKCSAAAVARLFLSGSSFRMPATQALSAGLVSEVVAADELDPRAAEIAASV